MYECTSTVKIKANSGFSLLDLFRHKVTKEPRPLHGISITAHIKNAHAHKYADFVVTVVDAAKGLFRLKLPADKPYLPVGTWYTDVAFVKNGVPVHSDTLKIIVTEVVTHV